MLDTGLRVGEVVHLTWDDIQLEPVGSARFGYVRVRKGKSKNAKRNVSLTPRVKRMLEDRREREPCVDLGLPEQRKQWSSKRQLARPSA